MKKKKNTVPSVFTPMNCEIISEVSRPPRKKMQIIAALIISIGILSASTALDVSLDFLRSATSYSSSDISWLEMLFFFGGLMGTVIASFIIRKFGRRIILITINVPLVSSWILIIASQHIVAIIFGRLFAGISIGIVYVVAPIYLSEIADLTMHGALVTLFPLFIILGNIVSTCFTFQYVTYKIFIIFFCVLSVCQMILLLWMPDSPYFILEQNRHSHASKSLKWLWGKHCNVHDTLDTLQSSLEQTSGSIKSLLKKLFTKRENITSLIICLTLMCLQQLYYFLNIKLYITSYDLVDPALSTLSFRIIPFLHTLVMVFIIGRVERRKLLFLSCSLMVVSFFAYKIYFAASFTYVDDDLMNSSTHNSTLFSKEHLPLLFAMIFNIGFGIGIYPIPWLIMVELFSSEVKAIGVSIVVSFYWVVSAIILKYFSDIIVLEQEAVVNSIFAVSTIVLLILIRIIPETKGKTNNEIIKLLTNVKLFNCKKK